MYRDNSGNGLFGIKEVAELEHLSHSGKKLQCLLQYSSILEIKMQR
jgi:hypothetical protein